MIRQRFKSTVVNRALPSLHGGSLDITRSLPLIHVVLSRIGRTGRLGNTGRAISFFDAASDSGLSVDLVRILADAQQVRDQSLANII